MKSTLEVRNFTRSTPPPRRAFQEAIDLVLPGWEISLVFAGEKRAQSINRALRKKDYIPNVLSYEVGKKHGEILICPAVAKRQAPAYGLSYSHFCLFLFIHALLHLKGMPHGARMEKYEREYFSQLTHAPLLQWHDASQQVSISAHTKRKLSSLKK